MAIKEGNSIYFDLTIEFLNTRQADTLKEAFALVKDFVYKRQNKMMQQKMMQRLNNQAMYFQENISQLSDSMNSVLAESKRANKNIQSAIICLPKCRKCGKKRNIFSQCGNRRCQLRSRHGKLFDKYIPKQITPLRSGQLIACQSPNNSG